MEASAFSRQAYQGSQHVDCDATSRLGATSSSVPDLQQALEAALQRANSAEQQAQVLSLRYTSLAQYLTALLRQTHGQARLLLPAPPLTTITEGSEGAARQCHSPALPYIAPVEEDVEEVVHEQQQLAQSCNGLPWAASSSRPAPLLLLPPPPACAAADSGAGGRATPPPPQHPRLAGGAPSRAACEALFQEQCRLATTGEVEDGLLDDACALGAPPAGPHGDDMFLPWCQGKAQDCDALMASFLDVMGRETGDQLELPPVSALLGASFVLLRRAVLKGLQRGAQLMSSKGGEAVVAGSLTLVALGYAMTSRRRPPPATKRPLGDLQLPGMFGLW